LTKRKFNYYQGWEVIRLRQFEILINSGFHHPF